MYATARRLESMDGLKHPNIHTLKLDVLEDDQVKEVIKTIVDREGRVDLLVNNAGSGAPGNSSGKQQRFLTLRYMARSHT